ncbi:DUF805 domain-containing protein [Rhizobium sp. KVB221]|uniref:DUF805 domain-containing protein n=1 Tax=Rhizobium setariae TaxID=2801340 RepID=A0A936YJJ0_9HYPH|nr:DUF805 domain-containing protein [Rhizobium setariae]MBL0371504.1 DUF805 domain-containing protein [Rhizobium setariae]
MNFTDAVKTVLTLKYADFGGRASRSEFWWYVLFVIIASVVLGIVDNLIGIPLVGLLFSLATLIPGLAVSIRRLHDKDKSGWWILICLVPLIGGILLIYWYATEGTPGDNQFGNEPVA